METSGVLLIDKPLGMTSHSVVGALRKKLQTKQIGHAGTLDPLATGLLVCLVGNATKLSNYLLNNHKAYEVGIQLGEKRETGDAEGEVVERSEMSVSPQQVKVAVENLVGDFEWEIPMYSAKKVKGQKLYELARKGQVLDNPPKKIMSFSETRFLTDLVPAEASSLAYSAFLSCSKGSFVRTWVEKLGESLGGCAYMSSLRRTFSSPYQLKQAVALDDINGWDDLDGSSCWIPMENCLPDWPYYAIEGKDERLLENGQISHRLARQLEVEYLGRGYKNIKVVRRKNRSLLALLESNESSFKIQKVFSRS